MTRILRKVEAIQADVTAWQANHQRKVDALERRVDDIEASVSTARYNTFRAASRMWDIQQNVLQRIEEIEKLTEISLLVQQGRLPYYYLPPRLWSQRTWEGSGVEDD